MLGYSSALLLVLVGGAPFWLLRMMTSGRYRAGLGGRLGLVPASLREAVRGRDVVWVHAVSVGEVMAAVALVEGLTAELPGLAAAVSTTTETGQELAKRRMVGMPVFYLPLDFAYAVRRYLRVLRPRLLVLMESELWPNLLRECGRAGVPVAVVNARVSDRSYPRYMRLRRMWRPLLERVSMFLAQGEETAERLRRIGVPAGRVRVTGNLKYDLRPAGETPVVAMLRAALSGRRLVVAGSTLEGEERLLLDAWRELARTELERGKAGAVLLLAPRHPDRFRGVAEMAEGRGWRVQRVSAMLARAGDAGGGGMAVPEGNLEGEPMGAGSVVLLDTIGDLAAVYGLATVAFVGGSLVPAGGHNPLEPARFGVPVVIGSDFSNFRQIVERMQAMDGIRVVRPEQMAGVVGELLRDGEEARTLGARGQAVFAEEAGATERTVSELVRMLGEPGGEPADERRA